MGDAGDGNEIVRAIFKLGQALSKTVFAEGIETGDQLRALKAMGCEYGQGYLLARPVDAKHAEGFVSGGSGPLAIA
jgi:EAL domain-containing protein (putative c-di-GMP-specific phosphodiesterase class I)